MKPQYYDSICQYPKLFRHLYSMLTAKELTYTYTGDTTLSFPDLECQAGNSLLLLGRSGCGKTTLLHLLGGLMRPKSGSVEVNNTSLNTLSGAQLDRFRGRHIGIVFQQSHFVQSLSVQENVFLAQHLAGHTVNKKAAVEILERLNIAYKAKAKPDTLSQGEQQRLAIARAIVNRPALVLADEPTSALDDHNTVEVIKLLEEQVHQQKAALVIVTHDARLKEHITNRIELSS